MSYDWYDEMERAEQEYDAKENEMAQEYKRGYEKGRADYEAECQKIFEDNPPMHFNHEQIMWLKEFVKIRCNQARADAIEELLKELCIGCAYLKGTKCEIKGGCPCSIGQSEIIRSANKVLEQLKEQNDNTRAD